MGKESNFKNSPVSKDPRNIDKQNTRARRRKHKRYAANENNSKKLKETVILLLIIYINKIFLKFFIKTKSYMLFSW